MTKKLKTHTVKKVFVFADKDTGQRVSIPADSLSHAYMQLPPSVRWALCDETEQEEQNR